MLSSAHAAIQVKTYVKIKPGESRGSLPLSAIHKERRFGSCRFKYDGGESGHSLTACHRARTA
jgi:hypothetical protein